MTSEEKLEPDPDWLMLPYLRRLSVSLVNLMLRRVVNQYTCKPIIRYLVTLEKAQM